MSLEYINHVSRGIANEWQQCDHQFFWKAIAPAHHMVQIYDDEAMSLRTLSAYAADGLKLVTAGRGDAHLFCPYQTDPDE